MALGTPARAIGVRFLLYSIVASSACAEHDPPTSAQAARDEPPASHSAEAADSGPYGSYLGLRFFVDTANHQRVVSGSRDLRVEFVLTEVGSLDAALATLGAAATVRDRSGAVLGFDVQGSYDEISGEKRLVLTAAGAREGAWYEIKFDFSKTARVDGQDARLMRLDQSDSWVVSVYTGDLTFLTSVCVPGSPAKADQVLLSFSQPVKVGPGGYQPAFFDASGSEVGSYAQVGPGRVAEDLPPASLFQFSLVPGGRARVASLRLPSGNVARAASLRPPATPGDAAADSIVPLSLAPCCDGIGGCTFFE